MSDKSSQFRAQLGALGLDPDAARSPAAMGERERLGGVRLPELRLPAKAAPPPRSIRWQLAALGASMLAALVIVAWPRPHDDLTPKGGANVRAFYERAGKVAPLELATRLVEGDRVRAELDAAADGTAYWLVTDPAGKALVDTAFVRASALPLSGGMTAPFAKSIQLVGPSAGEVLHVVFCSAAPSLSESDASAILRQPGCSDRAFTLRTP